jgi:hypothetical protein
MSNTERAVLAVDVLGHGDLIESYPALCQRRLDIQVAMSPVRRIAIPQDPCRRDRD